MMHFKTVGFSTLLSAVLIVTACGGGLSPEEARAKARDHMDKGDMKAAIIELKNALQEQPDAVETRRLLGEAYYAADNLPGASKELGKAVELGERSPEVILKLIKISVRLGQFDEALDNIELLPAARRIEAANQEGFAFLGLGKPDAAKDAFQRALEADMDAPEALVGLATIAIQREQVEEANGYLDRALKLAPTNRRVLLLKGELLLASRQPEDAIPLLEQALANAKGPDRAAPHVALARAQLARNAPDEAETHVKALEKLIPDNPMVHYLSGAIAYARNDRDTAEKELLKVLQFDPDNAPAALLLGSIKFSQGQLEQAEGHLFSYVGKVPTNLTARKLLAGVLLARNNVTSAVEVLEAGAPQAGEDAQYLSLLGTAHMRAGDSNLAAEYFEKAAGLSPDDTTIRTRLAMSQMATGAAENAASELEKVVGLEGAGIQPSILLVISKLRDQKMDEALAAAQAMVERFDDNPISHNMLGAVYLAREQQDQARAEFEVALTRVPGFVPAVLNLVRMDLEDGQTDTARQRLEAALEQQPGNARLLIKLSELAFAAGDARKGESYLQEARLKNPKALEPGLILARLRLVQRRVDDAAEILESMRPDFGQHPAWLTLQSRILLAQRNFSVAEEVLEKLLLEDPKNLGLRARLAQAKVGSNKLEEARSIYEGLLKDSEGKNPGVLSQLARIRAAQGSTEEALAYAARLERDYSDRPAGAVLRGDILASDGKFEEAAAAYRQALELTPSGAIVLRLAKVIEQGGDSAGADQLMREWLGEHPDDRVVKLALAGRQQSAGDSGEARKNYEALLKQNANNPVALNNLAWIYLEQGDPRALKFAELAHKMVPENAAILDTVGWVRLQTGQIEEGLDALAKAAEKAPNNREIQYHYAAALARSGNTFKAQRILKDLLQDGQDFGGRDEAEALLKKIR